MMTILEMVKKHGTGLGDDVMWKSVKRISDYIEMHKDEDPEAYAKLLKHVHADMIGRHFDEDCAREQISKMYYADRDEDRHYGPYWTDEEMDSVYSKVRGIIPDCYNKWDFLVTLNMMKSDYCPLVKYWFPSLDEADIDAKLVELSVAYLNDSDSHHPDCKIWCYFND